MRCQGVFRLDRRLLLRDYLLHRDHDNLLDHLDLLVVVFAVFEWRVRIKDIKTGWTPMVFPLLCALGGTLLLTHSHAIANVKDQLLIELTHTPLAIAGISAGWARWVEIRLDARDYPMTVKAAGWIWPVCILLCGLVLMIYREA